MKTKNWLTRSPQWCPYLETVWILLFITCFDNKSKSPEIPCINKTRKHKFERNKHHGEENKRRLEIGDKHREPCSSEDNL